MSENNRTVQAYVLGQKYAYATASLLLGIACFVNLLGLERALLAIVFAWLALKSKPEPRLQDRRRWGQVGLALGIAMCIMVPTVLLLFFDRVRDVVAALEKLQ
jgi:MFS family permease